MSELGHTHPEGDPVKKEISRLLVDMTKIIKIVSVYPENNPLPAKLKESFAERFIELIKDHGQIQFSINQEQILFKDAVVYKEEAAEDSLALMLHNSGITEISFNKEFNFESSHLFFKTLKSFVNKETGAGDLVNLFWQANIPGFDYNTVEDIILREYDGGIMVQEEMESEDSFIRRKSGLNDSDKIIYSSIFLDDNRGEAPQQGKGTPGGGRRAEAGAAFAAVSKDHPYFLDETAENKMGLCPMPAQPKSTLPDTTLILNEAFAMDQIDMEKVESILRQDAEFEMYGETVELLKEMLGQEKELSEFVETLTVVEKMQSEFVRAGRLEAAGEVLSLLKEFNFKKEIPQPWKDRINNALALSCSKEKFENLGTTLNRDSHLSEEALSKYLGQFGWEALSAVTGLLGELEHRHHREALCNYLTRTGREHIDIISRGIFDRRWFVVRNTVSILAGIGGEKAFSFLEKAVNHEDSRVRMQVIKGLQTNKTAKAAEFLSRLVWDKDEQVSQAALQIVMEQSDEDCLQVVSSMLNDSRFFTLNSSMQEQLMCLYSGLAGGQAVGFLLTLIDGWKAVKNSERETYRQLAFRALGNNKSEKAEKALLKFNRSWNKNVRRMATEAIALRRQVIYGGE